MNENPDGRGKGRSGLTRVFQQGVIVADGDSIIVSANDLAHTMFGHDEGTLVGQTLSVLMFEGDVDIHKAAVEVSDSARPHSIVNTVREVSARRRDGSEIEIDLAVTETLVDGQKYFIGYIRDLSFRRREDHSNQILSEELHAVLDSASSGLLMLDESHHVRHSNLAFRDMWGLEEHILRANPNIIELMETFDIPDLLGDMGVEGLPVEANRNLDIKLSDGRIVERRVAGLRSGGFLLTYYDVTLLKAQAETAQADADRRTYAMQAADQSYWEWNLFADRIKIGERFWLQIQNMYLGPEIDEGEFFELVVPEDREFLEMTLRAYAEGEV